MVRILSILFIVVLSFAFHIDSNPTFHRAKCEKGDGVYSLLRRYHLDKNACNHREFYNINKIEKGKALKYDKDYLLPILVYKYDGKSIRSTIGIDDWELASRIASYNRKLVRANVLQQDYQESKILWVPYHELKCNSSLNVSIQMKTVKEPAVKSQTLEKPVAKKEMLDIPIFGEKFSKFEVKDKSLKGKVFYLLSGHGGPDPGTVGKRSGRSLCEDEYAYDVVLRLAKNLMERGATVEIIVQDKNDGIRTAEFLDCDKDERVRDQRIPLNQVARLKQRTDEINRLYRKYKNQGVKDQKLCVLHIDSRPQHKRQDVFFYYYPESKSSKKLAQSMYDVFKAKYKQHRAKGNYDGFIKDRKLYVQRYTLPTSVFVELGNMQNKTDQKRLTKESNRQALADWLFLGLTR